MTHAQSADLDDSLVFFLKFFRYQPKFSRMTAAVAPNFVVGSPVENVMATEDQARDTVLLVEDDESLAKLFALLLQRSCLRVLHARSGEDCLRLFAKHQGAIALLLMDCNLPDAHGGTLCHRLRATSPGLPVLLTSGRKQDSLQSLLAADGPTGFLPKPFLPGDVVPQVRALLQVSA
jgi:CheY-like chemotaxis protein